MKSQIERTLQQVVEKNIQMLKREVRKETEKVNHMTSFVVGNNKVGTDLFSPSTHGFVGMTFEILLRLVHSMTKKHHARMRSLLNSGYLRLGWFKDCFQNQSCGMLS